MDFERTLLCCEEFFHSPTVSSSDPSLSPCSSFAEASSSSFYLPYQFPDDQCDDDLTIAILQTKQAEYRTSDMYTCCLLSNPELSEARRNAAHWMIKAHFILKFSPLTVALAVNYLDRYLDKNLSMPWKDWMMELLSVACLSVAAKMEEVDVPALLDLQVDGMEHLFQSKTVQRMELNVLSALGWKLRSVTPFTFVEKAINYLDLSQQLKSSLMCRASELLLSSLPEVEFLGFEPFVVAVTAICCSLVETIPLKADQLKFILLQYIPLDAEKLRTCYMVMESLIVDPLTPTVTLSGHVKFPLSPNTVIYNLEDNSSVDNSSRSHSFASNYVTERMDLQEYDRMPKRQRRH